MGNSKVFRAAVLSAVKHDYVARGMATHPRFELVVVADDPGVPDWAHERNQQLADAFGIPYIRDVERALRDFNVDVAIVSSEAHRHCDLSIRAVQAGVHVVQDKPLSTSRSEAERLVEAVQSSHKKFMMWNRNFLPAVLHVQQQVEAGAIGRVLAIHADFYFAKDAGPPKGTRATGYPPMNWLAHQIAAHVDGSDGALGPQPIGELANEGIYPLGYLRGLTTARVRRVFACSTAHFHQINVDNAVEDLATMTLELEGGIVGTIALGRIGLASHASGGEIKLHVVGTEGALVVQEARPDVGVYYRNQPIGEARQRRIANENDFRLAEHFAQAIDTDTDPFMNAHDSLAVLTTIEAALQSCRLGQPVDLL